MVKPGISRAVPMGILGFLAGALLVIVVRALQSLDPIWAVGPGIVFGTFGSAFAFVWGIGAFDPRLSVHGEEHHEEVPEEAAPPSAIFTSSLWQVALLTVLLIAALMAMAKLGPTLITTKDAAASSVEVANVPLDINILGLVDLNFGEVSELVIFVAFVIFALISLAAAAFIISFVMTWLSQGIVESRSATGPLNAPAAQENGAMIGLRILSLWTAILVVALLLLSLILNGLLLVIVSVLAAVGLTLYIRDRTTFYKSLTTLTAFIFLMVVLYVLFHEVLVGLVIPNPPFIRVSASFANALIITILLLVPWRDIQAFLGWAARLVASILRFVVRFLGSNQRADYTKKPNRSNRP